MIFPSHKPRQYYKALPDVHFINFLTPYRVASCLTRSSGPVVFLPGILKGKVRLSLYMSQRH
jgi:hypothetical protein